MKKNNLFNNRKLLYIILTLVVMIAIIYLGRELIMGQENTGELNNNEITKNQVDGEGVNMTKNPLITITMASGEEIKLELYPEQAPNTVKNFIYLINQGFYDGLVFHRVIKGFMIQGGDPDGNGTGGPGYSIKGEFSQNGFDNNLKHDRGVISMARSGHPDSAGSQFFLMHQDSPHLDGKYAAFGKVTEGMDVVDEIANVQTAAQDRPVEDKVMENVTVETFAVEYDEPEKV